MVITSYHIESWDRLCHSSLIEAMVINYVPQGHYIDQGPVGPNLVQFSTDLVLALLMVFMIVTAQLHSFDT